MGRGSYYGTFPCSRYFCVGVSNSSCFSRARRRFTRQSEDVQRFLEHPKPKSWINALSDHPALSVTSSRPCAHVHLNDEIKSEETPKVENKVEYEEFETTLPEKEQYNAEAEEDKKEYIDTDFEETLYGYETVYEKDELVGAIDEWMSRISDTLRVPWSDMDAMDSFPVLRSSIKLDPFHQFDWSQGGRSHTGRLVYRLCITYYCITVLT